MQFTREFKEAIRCGNVSCSFRTWKSPQAKLGGRYNLHPEGAIEVTGLRRMPFGDAKALHVKQSGFTTREALAAFLKVGPEDLVYLVEFRYLGDITVKAPPTAKLKPEDRRALADKLRAIDERSSRGPWACRTLALISEQPAARAGDLAHVLGWETAPFKANVRKLKKLGLTESLEIGYRLTQRGVDVLGEL